MIRKHKKFNKPKQLFDTERIKNEKEIVLRFGLKNKREIWKAKTNLDKFRNQAKNLIDGSEEEKKEFALKLEKLGFKIDNLIDVLALTEEDILGRRLQTVVLKKGLAHTLKEARQLITHKKIKVNGEIINKPSYQVPKYEEDKIQIIKSKKVKKPESENKEEQKEKTEEPKQEINKNGE